MDAIDDALLKSLEASFINLGTESVIAYLSVQFPFFAMPIVNRITKWMVSRIITILVQKTELGVTMIKNHINTAKQGKDFTESAQKYTEVLKNGTPEEIEKAKLDKINKARDLIRFNR